MNERRTLRARGSRLTIAAALAALLTVVEAGPGPPTARRSAAAAPSPCLSSRLVAAPGRAHRLKGGEAHLYRLALTAGDYLHLIVSQRGIDVVVTVFAPDGRRLFAVDTLTGDRSDEHVYLLAGRAGGYRFEIRPFDPSAPAAAYVLRVAERRPATRADRTHAAAESAFARARALEEQGRGEGVGESAGLYLQAARSWRRLGNRRREADALFRLGRLHRAAGLDREAVRFYRQALPLRDPATEAWERAVLLNDLGVALRDLEDFAAARKSLAEALVLHRRTGFRLGEANTRLNLGDLDRRQGRVLEALDHLERVLAIARQEGLPPTEVTVLNELGALYTTLGETGRALEHHRRALARLDPERDADPWATTLNLMGNAHLEAKDPEAAAAAYREALALRRRVTNPRGMAVSLAGLALAAERRGRTGEALRLYEEALRLSEEQGDRLSAAITLNNLASLLGETGRPERALELHGQALERARDLEDPVLEAAALFGTARAERRQGNLEAAGWSIREALRLVESLRHGALRSPLRAAYLASRQSYYAFYVDLLMERHRREPTAGHDARALGVAEQSRARLLLDSLAEDRDRLLRGVAPALLARQRELTGALHRFEEDGHRLLAEGADPALIAALGRRQDDAVASYHQLEEEIRRASPWYATLDVPHPLALPEIERQVVDAGTLLLEYHLGTPRSYLWVVSPSGLHSFELADRAALERAARRAYELLAGSYEPPRREAARQAAAELSRLLLGPAAHLLGTQRLVIVASGALQYIPFAVLPEPSLDGPTDAGAPPLIARHEIVSLPSASALAALRQQAAGRRPPPGRVAVVADPVFGRDDPRLRGLSGPPLVPATWETGLPRVERLPFSRQEASAILALAGGRTSGAFLGFDASRQLVLSGRLAGFRVLHFATHGWLDPRHPELSALLLSRFDAAGRPQDGRLRAHEVYELELPADLVVLSGCQTALGAEIEGEGLVGLTRGFLYAGASRVVVSLWKVSDRSTAELMRRFYRAFLVDGLPPSAALRQAQLSMLREERWAAPFHWSGFILQGDWT